MHINSRSMTRLSSSDSGCPTHPRDIVLDWIEIDYKYKDEMRYKASVIAEHPTRTVLSLPENDEACGELLQTLVDYLPKVRHV